MVGGGMKDWLRLRMGCWLMAGDAHVHVHRRNYPNSRAHSAATAAAFFIFIISFISFIFFITSSLTSTPTPTFVFFTAHSQWVVSFVLSPISLVAHFHNFHHYHI